MEICHVIDYPCQGIPTVNDQNLPGKKTNSRIHERKGRQNLHWIYLPRPPLLFPNFDDLQGEVVVEEASVLHALKLGIHPRLRQQPAGIFSANRAGHALGAEGREVVSNPGGTLRCS